jgi:hypothetical protein
MCRALRALSVLAAACVVAFAMVVARPSPPAAKANVGCSVATAPAGAITEGVGGITGGAIGGGNPVGDACNSVTDGAVEAVTSPVTSALKGIGKGILGQITTWVSEGATWLMGEVVSEIDKTTTPQLTSEGFLSEYGRMTQVAAILAAAMFVMALLEAVVQGSWAVLGKAIFVSVPLAFVGTSIAFVLVQMLLVITDGMSHAVTVATQEHSTHFFKSAIGDLSKAGGTAGGAAAELGQGPGTGAVGEAAGATAVPLFVTFLAAIVGAFAAFCVWIELLFRDAAVYVVVLFMPLAAAASISPRWAHVLRRYVELIVTVIGSKFVIVSVVALAATLISEKGASVEHIVAAAALLMVACFCPFLLFRLVLSTEAAASAAFARRSAGGNVVGVMQMAGGPQGFANMARSNWSGPEVWSVGGGGKGDSGADGPSGQSGGPGIRPPGSGDRGGSTSPGGVPGPGSGGGAAAGDAVGAAIGGGAVGGVASGVAASAQAARSTAQHLEQSGTARVTEQHSSSPASHPSPAVPDGNHPAPNPAPPDREPPQPIGGDAAGRGPAEAPPRPPREGQGAPDGGDPGE